jgi:GTP cyclohydrolase III
MDWFEKELVNSFDVKVVFYGGDNLLASVSLDKFEKEILEKLRFEFFKRSDSTLSIGLGESPQQAYLALKLAKTNGKNAIREFSELSHG